MEKAEKLLKNREFTISSYRILDMIHESFCSAYDCEFVALAVEKNVKLVTYEKLILKEFKEIAYTPTNYLALAK
jgi:predicted nucleic acid-binding protein